MADPDAAGAATPAEPESKKAEVRDGRSRHGEKDKEADQALRQLDRLKEDEASCFMRGIRDLKGMPPASTAKSI